MPAPHHILVSCGGKWAGVILQLREAMQRIPAYRGGRIVVASTDAFPAAGSFADVCRVVPPIRHPEYVDRLLEVCAAEGVRVIIPLIDVDLIRLAPARSQFAAAGVVVVTPPPDVVDLCFDKLRFARFAAERQLPHIPTWTRAELPAGSFPLFYKRRCGFGSIGSGECTNAAQLDQLSHPDELIFQPVLHAPEATVDAYIARSGACTVCVPRSRDKVVAGESYQSRTFRDARVGRLVRQTIAALSTAGCRGPLNVQLFLGPEPILLEVNTRLGSASVLGNQACGGRLLDSVLREAAGETVEGDPDAFAENVCLTRFLGDVFYTTGGVIAVKPHA